MGHARRLLLLRNPQSRHGVAQFWGGLCMRHPLPACLQALAACVRRPKHESLRDGWRGRRGVPLPLHASCAPPRLAVCGATALTPLCL
eukprot:4328178-Pleurochrysis_carterae.AAC.7